MVEQVVINNITESIVEFTAKQHKNGETPPELRVDNNNDTIRECQTPPAGKPNEISPVKGDITTHTDKEEPQKENWFSFSVAGMGKLSNALK